MTLANAPGDIAHKCLQLKCHNCVYTELPFKTAYDDALSKFQFMQSGVLAAPDRSGFYGQNQKTLHTASG